MISKKKKHSREIKPTPKLNSALAIFVIAVTAAIGVLLLRASDAASLITYYGKIEIHVTNSTGGGIGGTTVGIQSVTDNRFICRNSAGGNLWNGANATSYTSTDASGWAHFSSCLVYQASYASYAAAPTTKIGSYKFISASKSGWTAVSCGAKSLVPGSLFTVTGTKNGNGTLPANYGEVCMYAVPSPPPPPPTPPPTAPTPNPSPTPSPSSPQPSPAPSPTSSPSPPGTKPKSSTTVKKVSPPPPAPAVVKATSGDTVAPDAPQNFTATLDGVNVQLSWSGASDNVGVVAYSLERSENQTDWQYLSQIITDTAYTDSDLSKSTPTYYYRLRSIDAVGNASAGAFASIDVASSESPTTQSKTSTPAKNGKHIGLKVGGTLLLLLALGCSIFWWLRWRVAKAAALDEQIRVESFENNLHNPETGTPHHSESLDEMVMKDIHANNVHSNPPEDKE